MSYMRAITDFYGPHDLDPEYKYVPGVDDTGAEYIVIEEFCENPLCECKKILLRFFLKPSNSHIITHEYANFMCDLEDKSDPLLGDAFEKSDLTDYLAAKVDSMLNDHDYIQRLENHYRLIKIKALELHTSINHQLKIGRNDPCHCGSGKKYKKCCLLANT